MLGQENKNIKQIINLAKKMIRLSDIGFSNCEDDSCLLMYNKVRDNAYEIKAAAEKECQNHKKKGG